MADTQAASKQTNISSRNWRVVPMLVIWLALIFGTSCTVIRPEELFRLVSTATGAGRESMERFEVFWGVSWFAVVKGWHFTEFAILTVIVASALKWLVDDSKAG